MGQLTRPQVVTRRDDLRRVVADWHQQGLRVGLVPTMGTLHHGHLSLVDSIARSVDRVIVSIFVNPTQFGEEEDFDAYPRDLDGDLAKLAETPAQLVYAPLAAEIYPEGFKTLVDVQGLSLPFEGVHRPGHFAGVATVVAKLIIQSGADAAIFGEKDWQQLAVIRRMVKDLDLACDIYAGTLVREPDGLAASSRNVYLSDSERKIAGQFNRILSALVAQVEAGDPPRDACARAESRLLAAGFNDVDYVAVIDPDSMQTLTRLDGPARVVATVRIRQVRLLDTMAINAPQPIP